MSQEPRNFTEWWDSRMASDFPLPIEGKELFRAAYAAGVAAARLKPPSHEANDADARDAARYRWLRDLRPNSFSLSYNEGPAPNYVTAKQWIEEYVPEQFADDPPEAVEAMKAANAIWNLHVYPTSPVGFYEWSRASLDEVIDAAMEAPSEYVNSSDSSGDPQR